MYFPVGLCSINVLGRIGTCAISVLEDSQAKQFIQIILYRSRFLCHLSCTFISNFIIKEVLKLSELATLHFGHGL